MKIPLVITTVLLPWACLHAQNPGPDRKEGKMIERTIRLIVAGQRAMPEFERKGGQYVEVDPPAKLIMPTAVEMIGGPKAGPVSAGGAPEAVKPVWPNEIVNLGRCKSASSLRLRLTRTLAGKGNVQAPPEINCEIGEMKEPLVIVSSQNGGKGWDEPQVKVIDLSATEVPSRSVVILNMTNIPLATRFESEVGQLAASAVSLIRLPAGDSDVFRFRIDARSATSLVPLANSSYQIGKSDCLILLAVPNMQVAPGAPPLSLQMVLYTSGS